MVKRMMAVAAALMMLATSALSVTSAFAWSDVLNGRPEGLRPGAPTGYYLWHTEDGMHLATSGGGPEHHFTGTITTDGEFRAVTLVRGERVDSYTEDGGKTITLDFTTYGGLDGLNFRIAGGTEATYDLQMDGQPISVDQIYLGSEGVHPDTNPFTEPR